MRIDIIIVNYQSAADVVRCLDALGPWVAGTIWLVNNSAQESGSTADTLALTAKAQQRDDVRLLQADENLGFGRGCNLAYEQSNADVLILLNPDARIERRDLEKLVNVLVDEPDLGALSPAMFWNDGRSFLIPPSVAQTPAASVGLVLSTRYAWLSRWLAARELRHMRWLAQQPRCQQVSFLSGAVLIVRRSAAQEAAKRSGLPSTLLFDPDYFMFFEDTDLSLRLRRAGWRLGIHPGIFAVHEYRHKAYKAALMSTARAQYFSKRFRWFYQITRKLGWLDRLARPLDTQQRFACRLGRLHSALELAEKTGHAGVLALSPSLLTRPALFRPAHLAAAPLSQDEWDLLEAGAYALLVQQPGGLTHWCHFEREDCSRLS